MTSIELSGPRPESDRGAVRRLVDRATYQAEHPFSTLAAYDALLVAMAAIVLHYVPSARAAPNVVGVRVH